MLANACYTQKNLLFAIYKTLSLPVLLYRCETLSVTLREAQKRMVENRVLMRIIEKEVKGD
jgi:hypothetical protein